MWASWRLHALGIINNLVPEKPNATFASWRVKYDPRATSPREDGRAFFFYPPNLDKNFSFVKRKNPRTFFFFFNNIIFRTGETLWPRTFRVAKHRFEYLYPRCAGPPVVTRASRWLGCPKVRSYSFCNTYICCV